MHQDVPQLAELKAEVARVTFKNDETGYAIIRVKGDEQADLLTVVGPLANVNQGERLQLFGAWTQHPQYGKQFKAERVVNLRPNRADAIVKFLASGALKGIGQKTAEKIVKRFGIQTFNVLDDEPHRLSEIRSLSKKKQAQIIDSWKSNQKQKEILLFLSQQGIHGATASKIIQLYGSNTIDVINQNPYRLAKEIRGIGFTIADRIAQSVGIEKTSKFRIQAGVLFALEQGEDQGHCYLMKEQLLTELANLLGLDVLELEDIYEDCLEKLEFRGEITINEVILEDGEKKHAIYSKELYLAEKNLAENLKARIKETFSVDSQRVDDWILRYTEASATSLSEHQLHAVKSAIRNPVFVLTGGPGVGKTTTANAIIRLLKAMGKGVALCAPTGRAAQRLSEVAAIPAKTIHRLLEWNPSEGGFLRNEDLPIPTQALVIDESSMLDLRLADALIRAVPLTAQIIFIGDVDQLPSVGAGSVLKDLIESEQIPFVKLTEIFRQAQASMIVRTAHAINDGTIPDIQTLQGSDCEFVLADQKELFFETIKDLYVKVFTKKLNFHPIRDVQLLTPMNRGDLGTSNLNLFLQEYLNPAHPNKTECKTPWGVFRSGDKVIQTSNNYDLGVFNGDIGYILGANVDGAKIIVQYADKLIRYDEEQSNDLKLAYAITIHKSQGSEFPAVILAVSMSHYVMLQRNLIYTGLTRAKKYACFLGTPKALAHAIRNNVSSKRQSLLLHRLRS